jgi:DNA-binding transcriptional regulator YiaG
MTQRELALYLGVSVRTVAYWEAGTHPVPLGAARSLARLLRRPLPQIVEAAGLPAPRVPDPRTWRPEDLGTVVAALRRSAGWSAAGLGRRLGMSRWTVRRWESGTTRPSMSACRRMEDVFRLPRGSLTRICGQATVSGAPHIQGSGSAADGARTGADRWRAEDPAGRQRRGAAVGMIIGSPAESRACETRAAATPTRVPELLAFGDARERVQEIVEALAKSEHRTDAVALQP